MEGVKTFRPVRFNRFRRRGAKRRGGGGKLAGGGSNAVLRGDYRNLSLIKLPMNQIAPDSVIVKMNYPTVLRLAGATPQFHVYRGNSLFDPDFTGAGQQPGGFDQWMALYTRYRVLSSKIKIVPSNESSVGNVIVAYPSLNPLSPGTYQQSAIVPYNRATIIAGAGGVDVGKFQLFMKTGKLYGMKNYVIKAEDEFQATAGANPVNQWYWCIYCESLDGASAVEMNCTVNITYYVKLERRSQVAIS